MNDSKAEDLIVVLERIADALEGMERSLDALKGAAVDYDKNGNEVLGVKISGCVETWSENE